MENHVKNLRDSRKPTSQHPPAKAPTKESSTPISAFQSPPRHLKSSSRDSSQRHSQPLSPESLLGIYADNFCPCQSVHCKKELTGEFQRLMKGSMNKSMVGDVINMLTGSSKSQKSINLIWFFLHYMSLNTISKELLNDILRLFVVLYLKSNTAVKVTIMEDLDNIFLLIKGAETKLFVDKAFKYKIFFHGICQFRHCLKCFEQTGKSCDILNKSLGMASKKKGEAVKAQGCQVHDTIEIKDFVIDLSSKKQFIPYVCFLAQLNFKILNIEDKVESLKESRRKFICNLLFSMIEQCKSKYFYYPLRALAEFFLEEENEKALSKRLNSESLLEYKKGKEVYGREIQLMDFNKRNPIQKRGEQVLGSGYKYLYADTLSLIRAVLSKLEQEQHLDCFILCLSMLQKILEYEINEDYKHNAVSLYIDCLVTVSQNLQKLSSQEKECYYSQVKNLIKLVRMKRQGEMEEEELEGAKLEDQDRYFYKVGDKFLPRHLYHNMEEQKTPKETVQDSKQKYPSLSVLKHLLTLQAIQSHPKLSLLVFETLFPYVEVFNNQFVSFIGQCQQNRLIVNEFNNNDVLQRESLKKKIKLCDGASAGREVILNFYLKGYKENLEEVSKKQGGSVDPVLSLDKKRRELSREELMFMVDFLLQICKHAQIFDEHAVTLGTHLLTDFYTKTNQYLDGMLSREHFELPQLAELMFVNFDLRSRVFISHIIKRGRTTNSEAQEVKDEIFN